MIIDYAVYFFIIYHSRSSIYGSVTVFLGNIKD